MDIQCECGQFHARLKAFPRNTPGRLVCYCDDCQAYLHHLKRNDLLDAHGGTEVIPAYPADIEILSGREHLKCTRLSPKGAFRFSVSCCNSPIVGLRPGMPWASFPRSAYPVDEQQLDQTLGPVRSRVMGRYAQGTPPAGTADKLNLKAVMTVLPFMLKGVLLKKSRPSPFFAEDGLTPIVMPQIVNDAPRQGV